MFPYVSDDIEPKNIVRATCIAFTEIESYIIPYTANEKYSDIIFKSNGINFFTNDNWTGFTLRIIIDYFVES